MRVRLAIPCYNEAKRLDLAAFDAFLASTAAAGVALCFVDDGSTDATVEVLERLASRHPGRIEVLRLPANRGKAEAVRIGLLHGLERGAELVGFVDADLAAPLEAALDLVKELDRHPEACGAIGSRVRLLGREIERSALRHYLGRIFATAASLTLGLPVYDTQCGLKVFRASPPVREALAVPFASRWIFDVELLARLTTAGGPSTVRFREVPLERWHARAGSRLRAADFLRAAIELIAIRRRYRGGR